MSKPQNLRNIEIFTAQSLQIRTKLQITHVNTRKPTNPQTKLKPHHAIPPRNSKKPKGYAPIEKKMTNYTPIYIKFTTLNTNMQKDNNFIIKKVQE